MAADSLSRLRGMHNNSQLAEHIPAELHRAGFGRTLFSSIRDNVWWVQSAYVPDDAGMVEALVRIGRAYPRQLDYPLPESAMVRDHTPILIQRPQKDPRVHAELAAISKSNSYVAAPVYIWQQPVALLHADTPAKPGGVSPSDRDLIGTFAEGIGVIFERNLLLGRLQVMRELARQHTGDIFSMSEMLEPYGRVGDAVVQDVRAHQLAQLTHRERQVLDLLSVGNTNAKIAAELFVTQNTVKSHVRHIMRKLDASSRAEAVSRYLSSLSHC